MKNIYLLGGIFVVRDLILIILIIFPLINGIQSDSRDLILQKFEMSSLEQKKGNLENLKRVYESRQTDLEKIEAVFVDSETPIDFISFLDGIAADSQAAADISLAKTSSGENSLSFHISLESSFPNFLKFLEKLENGPYLVEVLNLNITRTTEGRISTAVVLSVLAEE